MFWYLSFLRPPPSQSTANVPVLVTPQICNDLRTETCPNHHDIYYQWLPSPTKPQKLTSWNPGNPYPKPVPVPPPLNARPGQSYTLALSCSSSTSIPLNALGACPVPFPVLSQPVVMLKGKDQSKKQEKIDRVYTLLDDLKLVITEQTSFDLDKKIWDSGIGLSAWLTDLARESPEDQEDLTHRLRNRIFSSEPCSIIELGAGTGIVSLALAALRSRIIKQLRSAEDPGEEAEDVQQRDLGRIVTTDLDTAIPVLENNIKKNVAMYGDLVPEAVVLDWDKCQESVPSGLATRTPHWDAIVMADVTYNTSSFPSLVKTLSTLLKRPAESPHRTIVLLGYKQRDIAERRIFGLLKEEADLDIVRVGSVDGWPGTGENGGTEGEEIEIWVGVV